MLGKEPCHLCRPLQMPLCVLLQPLAGLKDGQVFADACQDVLQRSTFRVVVEHVIDGEQRHVTSLRQVGEHVEPHPVLSLEQAVCGQPHPAGCHRAQLAEDELVGTEGRVVRQHDEKDTF